MAARRAEADAAEIGERVMTDFYFETEITITIAGVERTFDATVTGRYSPAVRAYVPRGEYGPIDPPEPEFMEDDNIRRALEEEARASMQPDPDRGRD